MTLPSRKIPAALVPIFAVTVLVATESAAQAGPPTITRFKLDNGIRVVVLHVKNSKSFAAISYLPLGLACDGAKPRKSKVAGPFPPFCSRGGRWKGISRVFSG